MTDTVIRRDPASRFGFLAKGVIAVSVCTAILGCSKTSRVSDAELEQLRLDTTVSAKGEPRPRSRT